MTHGKYYNNFHHKRKTLLVKITLLNDSRHDIEGLELKPTISIFQKKMSYIHFPSVKQPYFACTKPLYPISN